jgi:uncharacterized protein with HEPN domain
MKDTAKFLQDIVEAIDSVESYAVTTFDVFLEDNKSQDAIMFNLVIMGEAANRIPEEYRESHPEIPWSSMIGTRNVIVHGYDQVKMQIVWDIINKDLGGVKKNLLSLL